MPKELIRNGGFERGNLDFWACDYGTAEVVSDVKKRGSYSAKVITGSSNYALFGTKDFIEVSPYQVYKITGWYKSVSWSSITSKMWFYDSDYNYISGEDITVFLKTGTFDWVLAEEFFLIPSEASYIMFNTKPLGTSGSYGYLDSISLQRLEIANLAVYNKELIKVVDQTSTGTFYGDYIFSGIWRQGEFHLDVSNLTGTDPTLDVIIRMYNPVTLLEEDIVVFDRATASGRQLKIATAGLGWKVRVKYVLGGTITDCDFTVGAIFKR